MKETITLLNEKQVDKPVLYKNIISPENLAKGVDRTKNNVAPGLDGITKAQFDEKKLEKLYKELKSQRYQPSPVKRVNVPKPDGGTRPLGVASQRDKVVQAAILNQLEPVLENIFLDCSYGGRSKISAHHALKEIKTKWQNITWIISIDIRKYFDNINHEKLLTLLSEFCDQQTVELIRKLVKCGYVDVYNHPNKLEDSPIGTPQGSLISPILSNLYLHSLDCYVTDKLLPEYNRGNERKFISGYQTRKTLSAAELKVVESLKIEGLKQAIERLKHNEWVKAGLPSRDPQDDTFRRMRYVRYVDDFIIGYCGPKSEADTIKRQVETYLREELLLEANDSKSFIKHSSERGIMYLGFFLRYFVNNKIIKDPKVTQEDDKGLGHLLKSTALNKVQLRIPVEKILRRAVDRGYAKIRKDGKSIRASSCRKLSSLEDKLIVQRFSSIIRGLMNYYSPANQYSDLWQIVALYRKSCALTLADKHKLKTAAKAFKRYGPNLKITTLGNKESVLFYPTSLKTTADFKLGKPDISLADSILDPIQGSYKSNIKMSSVCQWPGCKSTDNLEEHHVNPVRNIKANSKYEAWLRKRVRKTVTLCREHHIEAEKLSREK